MKAQLLKLLTICLISLAVISPTLIFWKIWQCHNQLMHAQRAVLTDNVLSDQVLSENTPPENHEALNQIILASHYEQFLSTNAARQQFQSGALAVPTSEWLSFIISIFLGFCSGLFLNNFYQTRRDITLKQKVATLEKIWQQSIY